MIAKPKSYHRYWPIYYKKRILLYITYELYERCSESYLYPPLSNHSVPDSIKDFIKENINLLFHEIYANLVSNGMD